MEFFKVCVAGTFDLLHRGHEAVLKAAFVAGEKVVIALTTDEYVKKFKVQPACSPRFGGAGRQGRSEKCNLPARLDSASLAARRAERAGKAGIKSFKERKKNLEDWLKQRNLDKRAEIMPLDDPIGPSVRDNFDALVVTSQNKANGEKINALRVAQGQKPIKLLEVPLIKAEDEEPISSTRLRRGEIDRNGKLFLPDSLRPELQQPLGKLLVGEAIKRSLEQNKQAVIIVAVGDVTTKTLLDAGVTPALTVIDQRVAREPYSELKLLEAKLNTLMIRIIRVQSGPGYISQKAMRVIRETLKTQATREKKETRPTLLIIEGEEDLLTLPATAYAPIGSVVYYGQPLQQGLVEVKVTQAEQRKAKALLAKFTN